MGCVGAVARCEAR
jgi:hypothetical protein